MADNANSQNSHHAENGSIADSGGTHATATPATSAQLSTERPPIGHILFAYGALGANDAVIAHLEFLLQPPMVVPPAIQALVDYYEDEMAARALVHNPAMPKIQPEYQPYSALPGLPEGMLDAAMAEIRPLFDEQEVLAALGATHNKKGYTAPEPDNDTFHSQEAFLSSLRTIDIESLDQDSLKCGICWKVYGEAPDPGEDNSEQPVRLRCSHVYGHKCLEDLFKEVPNIEAELIPLCFDDPTSRACELGRKLEALLGNAPEDTHQATIFNALNMAIGQRKGIEVFGSYLWTIFDHLKTYIALELSCITLMENAVVLDPMPRESKTGPRNPNPFIDEALDCQLAFDQGQPITGPPSPSYTPLWVPILVQWRSSMNTPTRSMLTDPNTGLVTKMRATGTGDNNSPGTTPELPEESNVPTKSGSLYDVLMAVPPHLLEPLALYMSMMRIVRVSLCSAAYNEFLEERAHELAAHYRIRQKMMILLAEQLADIYHEYLAAKPQLENADSTADQATSVFQVCDINVMIHEVNMEATSLEIAPPKFCAAGGGIYTYNDADNVDYASGIFIISRFTCLVCFNEKPRNWPDVESVNWKKVGGTPDSCPLCQRILFRERVCSPVHDH